ncbi:MAG: hypothetical protein K5656_01595 [Lachnospiraceae bacterium]|nr:hypothetical protein [Lachnospiraceae bacterium]
MKETDDLDGFLLKKPSVKEVVELETNSLFIFENDNFDKMSKDELVSELDKIKLDDPDYNQFMDDLRELNNAINSLMTPTEDGWKDIDSNLKKEILDKYKKSNKSMDKFYNIAPRLRGEKKRVHKIVKRLAEMITADLNLLNAYDPTKKLKTFPVLLSEARTLKVDVANKSLKSMSGKQSARIPMKILGPDGNLITGYFTKANYYDPEKEIALMLEEVAKNIDSPLGKQYIRDLYKDYMDYYKNHPSSNPAERYYFEGRDELTAMVFIEKYKKKSDKKHPSDAMDEEKLLADLSKFHNVSVDAVRKEIGAKGLYEFCALAEKKATSIQISASAMIRTGDRIDTRNTAMSIVADLIGVSDVICKSKAMKIVAKDGTEIDGTFMEESSYTDPLHPGVLTTRLDKDVFAQTDGVGFRQLADLQVLDYICGNIDRHPGNVFFKIDQFLTFEKVMGIDNDCSFGELVVRKENYNRMIVPKNMGILSKKTADAILALDGEHLKFSLIGKLSKKQIDCTIKRLNIVKETILESRKKLDPDSKEIKEGYIRELEDVDFMRLKYIDLQKQDNIFHSELGYIAHLPQIVQKGDYYNSVKYEELAIHNKASLGGLTSDRDNFNNFLTMLDERTKTMHSSDNYRLMHNAVRKYTTLINSIFDHIKESKEAVKNGDHSPEAIYGQYVSRGDLIKMQDGLKKVHECAKRYYDKKVREYSKKTPSDYTKARMDAALAIIEYAKRGIAAVTVENETVSDNTMKATDQMVKLMKADSKKDELNINPANAVNNESDLNKSDIMDDEFDINILVADAGSGMKEDPKKEQKQTKLGM